MLKEIIKVAYICHFSTPRLHEKLPLKLHLLDIVTLAARRKPINTSVGQFAVWNDNAINEIRKHANQVEFHVITPYPYLKKEIVEFAEDNIHFHIFRDHSIFTSFVQRNIIKNINLTHTCNRNSIVKIIESNDIDVVHVVGAENPYYSLAALDIPTNIPLVVQLQTLMSEPGFEEKYNISRHQYSYRSALEREIIRRADYIGTNVEHFKKVILQDIKPNAEFLDMPLAVAEPIVENKEIRTQDFIYFAKDISKAADWAIEAFAIAHKKHHEIQLKIVGGYTPSVKSVLDTRLLSLGIEDAVTFTGMLPTHEDVLHEVRKSKYAILPIKADIITGTIREAMSSCVPVVTTMTPGTPLLNKDRESILISAAGDFEAMAENMCRLINDKELYNSLQNNALVTVAERYNNQAAINHWIESYQKICHKAQ